MMGNNRQVLKDNLAKDLQTKIDTTTATIIKLRSAISTVDKSGMEAKAEVQKAVDSVIEQVVARKLELNKQIDGLCQAQILSLQESIESAYLKLGNLQSTLSNLDSYDSSQLVNLSIPDAARATNLPSDPPLQLRAETTVITEELKKWIATSVNRAGNLDESSENMPTQKLSSPSSDPFESKKLRPLFPENFLGIVNVTNKKDVVSLSQKDPKEQIEHWLSGMKIGTSDDSYELLSNPDPAYDFKVSLSPSERKPSDCESESSILCVEMDKVPEDDISMWLKPKKKRTNSSLTDLTNQAFLHKSRTSNKTKSLDFPCLQQDPSSWIPKRKKTSSNFSCRTQQMCLQVGQTEIIPPTYALPYPFWLKK